MNEIKSTYKGHFTSKTTKTQITSKTTSDIQSKSNIKVDSDIEAATERAAFLATAKRNASVMFSKYL